MKKKAFFSLVLLLFILTSNPSIKSFFASSSPFETITTPSLPNVDYTPVVVPNGATAPYKVVDNYKVFHLIAEEISWEVAPGLTINAWGFNGRTPGPVIEVCQGDKVRIYVTNKLPTMTSIHFHGVQVPCGMDGVAGLTQPPIPTGETFVYEFTFPDSGTFMYYPHYNGMIANGMGLSGMIVVHKRELDEKSRPDRDFALLLHEWKIDVGTFSPNTMRQEFNIFTINGKVMPATEPLVAEIGDKVWIRLGNVSAIDHHSMSLHGHSFKVIGTAGGWVKDPSLLPAKTTLLVPTRSTKLISFTANNPGDWLFQNQMTPHCLNQMGQKLPNNVRIQSNDLENRIRKFIPEFRFLGVAELSNMTESGLAYPENSIPLDGLTGRWGNFTTLGGMTAILRIRDKTDNYKDPGPYDFPEGTSAKQATAAQLNADGIYLLE